MLVINNNSPMNDHDLNDFIEYVKIHTGIKLNSSKRYLLESRLSPVLRKFNLGSYSELLAAASGSNSKENEEIINAITTNETYFFRDVHPFDLLKDKLLPNILWKCKSGVIKIASAGCSRGQEAYSIAMILKDMGFDLANCRIKIEAFDISSEVVDLAYKGEYSKFEVERGLSAEKIKNYFKCVDGRYKVNEELKSIVSFSKRNLLKSDKSISGFDIIFCRNVASYFEAESQNILFDNLTNMLLLKGVLVIGAAEFLNNRSDQYERISDGGSVYYEKYK